jgi:short-subunit dehydrogenase
MYGERKKYALTADANTGIDLELAGLFAKDDYNLITVARSEAGLEETSGQLSQQ